MLPQRLRFGAFIAPFHPVEENPTLAIQRDLELVEWLDQLNYDEAWIGEHHSAAYELIASPEVFIAAAAERTKHIRLGTGVSSLPYHHPLMLADRINQLDHMTRGRVMFGAGPGALVSDAWMMGIPVQKQRDRMDEALGVLVKLLRGEEVTHQSDWFELKNARLQMTPYSRPSVEMAVASQVSPTGARAAGQHGLGLLSLG
ncbi:MAG: luciferase-like protein, partial [Phenylobacterium sp.]|nr:luciferase-like protein [Phenylobacterium sp.]